MQQFPTFLFLCLIFLFVYYIIEEYQAKGVSCYENAKKEKLR